jgi:fructose-specific phosphotransferase system IIC component
VVDINGLGYALDELVFVIARLLSAGIITFAAGYIWYHQWFTERLRPTYVWSYVGICLSAVALFRWFVVLITIPQMSDFYEYIEPWLQPMTQTGYALLGMCFIVMTYTHIRARARHKRTHRELGSDDE